TERGPDEQPVLVESYDEFVEQFGLPVDGMLAPLLAKPYFDNGGQQLMVARFVSGAARRAQGELAPAGGAAGAGETLAVEARDSGDFGNDILVDALITVRKRSKGTRGATPTTLVVSGLSAQAFDPVADKKQPAHLIGHFDAGQTEAFLLLA